MFRTFFKISFRFFRKNKKFTIISSLGLSAGLAAFIIILLYLNHEQSYDKWSGQLNRVYRVATAEKAGENLVGSPYPLGNQMTTTCPEVEAVTRIIPSEERILTYEENSFYENKIIYADSSFFTVFPYRFVWGNAATALKEPNSVVVTHETAKKLFGKNDPVGKSILLSSFNASRTLTVSGVIEITGPSHLNFNYCLSYFNTDADNWGRQFYITYALLKKNALVQTLEPKASAIFRNGYTAYHNQPGSVPSEEDNKNINPHLVFEPVSAIHLHPKAFRGNEGTPLHPVDDYAAGNNLPVTIFSLVGILILLISCINYTNLAIARAVKRTKEIGMRKMLGSPRYLLILQFLFETFLSCLSALFIALLLVWLLLPLFNNTFNIELSVWNDTNNWQNLALLLQLLAILAGVTLIAGSYPAFLLSRFRAVKVLKEDVSKSIRGMKLRNSLIVAQFVISVSFLIGMSVINRQVTYMQTTDPGFNAQQVLALKPANTNLITPGRRGEKLAVLTNELQQIPGVESVTATNTYPGKPSLNIQDAYYRGDSFALNYNHVYFGYFPMMQMQVVQGRDFSAAFSGDSVDAAILNESAVQAMHMSDPVGKTVNILLRNYRVIGVLKDNYNDGYTTTIQPTIYAIGAEKGLVGYDNLLVKVNAANARSVTNRITAVWKDIEPGLPLRYSWVKEDFNTLLEKYEKLERACFLFTIISLLIALIGLWALATFIAEQRTREMGIRKVFGAGTFDVLKLMNKDFLKLVLLANLIAWPVAFWIAREWLNGFAYRIHISALSFIGSLLLSLALTIISVSIQVWRIARASLVKSLRYE